MSDHKTIAVQLYTLREQTAQDMAGVLKKVAEIGYEGVELAGYGNLAFEDLQRAIKDNGLKVVGSHVGFDRLDGSFEQVIEENLLLDNRFITCSSLADDERTAEGYVAFAKRINDLGAKLNSSGMQLVYHNHHFEFVKFGGEYALDILFNNSDANLVKAELDTFWIKRGGEDPASYIRKYPNRVPLLHIKDMEREPSGDDDFPWTEVGNGILDWPGIFAAADEVGTVAYIVEQDTCPGDPFDSIRQSYENLKSWGKTK